MLLQTNRQPCLLICIAIIVGIVAGKYLLPVKIVLGLALVLIPLFFLLAWRNHTHAANPVLFLLLMLAAACRYHQAATLIERNHYCRYLTSEISAVRGVVEDAFYRDDENNRYMFCAESLTLAAKSVPVQGKLLLQTRGQISRFSYGDRLLIKACPRAVKVISTPGQFDYRAYLQDLDIYAIISLTPDDSVKLISGNQGNPFVRRLILPAREYCRRTFGENLPAGVSALLQALILGEKQNLDRHLADRFQKAGVVHVLAISGLHVGFIIAFVFSALTFLRFGRTSRMMVLIAVLVIYCIMIRFKTPVIRASIMAVLFMGGELLERKTSVYNIIFASLTLILLYDPRSLFQAGFQFSFMAVFSIVYGYKKFEQFWPSLKSSDHSWRKYFGKWIRTPFLVSVSAVAGTLPLSLYYYGLIPVYAVFANLIIIPIAGLIVFLSLFLLLFQPLGAVFAAGLGSMIAILFRTLQGAVLFFNSLPFASVLTVIPDLVQLIFFYIVLLTLINFTVFRQTMWPACLGLLTMSIVCFPPSGQQNGVHISFIDVGQGDAALISFPNGKNMLVDGGDRSKYWDNGARVLLPYLQATGTLHLDYMVGSHPHNDHIGGFVYLMDHVDVDTLVLSPYTYHSFLYRQINEKARDKGIFVKEVLRGDQLRPDRNCRVYILHPDSQFATIQNFSGSVCNNSSLVMKIQYGENAVLFTGDLEKEGETPVLSYGNFLESEILKAGHHGSLTSTSDRFLRQVNPIAAVISVGEKNRFKHPSPWTLNRLRRHGSKTLLTSQQGTIDLLLESDKITRLFP